MSRILIKNVRIIDGLGGPGYEGHVAVNDRRIEKIMTLGPKPSETYERIIDGEGKVLSPGFIDSHSHSDLMLFKQMLLKPKLRQGITTEVLGQDGVSVAPLPMQHVMDWRKNLAGLDGEHESFNWNFGDIKGYLTCIDSTSLTSNMTYLIPHGNVRMSVIGFEDREPRTMELVLMKNTVREAMEIGCPGMSAGLIYTPGAYALEEELTELCKVVAAHDGVFVVHQRSEADQILDSLEELFRIAEKSGVRLHISHFKLCGRKNWHLMDQVMAKLDSAEARGIELTFDMYPYTAGSTMLSAVIPPWAREGGTAAMLARLRNPSVKEKVIRDIMADESDWDNFIDFSGTDGIYITDIGHDDLKWCIGKNLGVIGEALDLPPVEAALYLLVKGNNHVSMVDFYGSEAHLDRLIQRKEGVVCTDGLLGGKAHPRVYGAFPRVIHQYVSRRELISLEKAVMKMTSLPAKIYRLPERGRIEEGYIADLILFDAHAFRDTNSYEEPHSYPDGLEMVIVGGKVVFDKEAWHPVDCGELVLCRPIGQ